MEIIKLNAIGSTNSFLRELSKKKDLKSYTVVVAENQINGRGQMHTNWHSEPHKNLTFSVLINNLTLKISNQKYLNFAVSLAIYNTLKELNINEVFIKWANDIMADNKKICGILIENSIKENKIISSIVGIGLNVNQTNFPPQIKKATSLKLIKNCDFNLNTILEKILLQLEKEISLLEDNKQILENKYLAHLFKKDKVATFMDTQKNIFNGIIRGVSQTGNLKVELEDDTIKEFGIKEISFA